MANDNIQTLDSKERVAYELMTAITHLDSESEKRDREYVLTLYRQCYKAVSGHSLDKILDRQS